MLLYFLGLITAAQVLAFASFNAALTRDTRRRIDISLEAGAHVFSQIVKNRTDQLTVATRVLSEDFAFKAAYAYATKDPATVLSALENHRRRIRANVMMAVSPDAVVVADTMRPGRSGMQFAFPGLIRFAEARGGASSIVYIGGRAYQLVVAPLKAPETIAWICAGFIVDDTLARELKRTTQADVSFLRNAGKGHWTLLASTLAGGMHSSLERQAPHAVWKSGKTLSMTLDGDEYVSLMMPLGRKKDFSMNVVLQRSLQEALAPFRPLRITLFVLFGVSIAGTFIGAVWIARTVTHPVNILVDGVRRAAKGDFGVTVDIARKDEIGELADAFNDMTRGLAERDRVRDLLGKVVSHEVAEELMKKGVVLGGEEREVTILFSDIRNFTPLSERMAPSEVLGILNAYLTRMSDIVERNGGVVDKYVGDAVMAIFGAPLVHEDDADRALHTAIEMVQALDELNREFRAQGRPELRIGVGVNTAVVVAGNMGSQRRLNYSVIGDGVNVAARLESLTKDQQYTAKIIVSDATLKKAKDRFETRFLGDVAVKGKSETTAIYALSAITPPGA
jgi:adenylate cyclase